MRYLINDSWTFLSVNNNSEVISLPHDAMLEEKRDINNPKKKQSGYFCGGIYTYIKELDIKKEWLNKDISLFFEGVYNNSKIYVNDVFVHENKYGFIEFEVSISQYIHEGKNIIKVIADNSLVPSCRWYSGAGIYRDVSLIVRNHKDIRDVKVITKSIDPVVIVVSGDNNASFNISIFDQKGCLIYEGANGEIHLDNVQLWDADNPTLYTLKYNENDEIKFGIRKIELIKGKGLFINNQKTLLRGGCIHSDNGVLGAVSYKESEYRKVYKLKQEGFNALRMAHNPCSRYMLEACDELGMYVLDEAFDGWYIPKEYHDSSRYFKDIYEYVLTQMVRKDFNHPSVIMYSIGNEVSETAKEDGIEWLGKLTNIVKTIDDTRPVTCGINLLLDVYANMGMGVYKDKGEYKKEPLPYTNSKQKEKKNGSAFFNYLVQKLGSLMFFISKGKGARNIADKASKKIDVLGLNYASSRYEIDSKRDPNRFMVGTETFIHELSYNFKMMNKYPNIIGDFVWAAWDYLGEAGVGDYTYPSYKGLPLTAGSGAIDLIGNNTAEMEYMKVIWGIRKEPYIGVFPMNHKGEIPFKSAWRFTNSIPSYNWQPFEGDKCKIEIFSMEPVVELFQNGKSLGKKNTKEAKAYYSVKYLKGNLLCKSFDKDGNEKSSSKLESNDGVKLLAEFESNRFNDDSIKYMSIRFIDSKGNLIPYMEEEVEINIDNQSLSLIGFGSAISKTNESYLANKFMSYRGALLAVFKVNSQKKAIINIKSESNLTTSIVWEGK